MISFGERNKFVFVEVAVYQTNDFNEVTITDWQPVEQLWAAVKPLSGVQVERSRQAQLKTTHVVKIDYRSYLTKNHRLRWEETDSTGLCRNRVLNIADLINFEERSIEHHLQCVEVTSG